MTERVPSERRLLWWAGFGLTVAVAGALSTLAYEDRLPAALDALPGSDKLLHGTMAGALAFLLDGALGRRGIVVAARRIFPLAALLVLLPVGVEELLQRLSPVRSSSIWDYLADCVGVTISLSLPRRLFGRRDPRRNEGAWS